MVWELGVLQQQVTCVLGQRIILRIRRVGFVIVRVLIIVSFIFFLLLFFLVGAALHMCTYSKNLFAKGMIYDFVKLRDLVSRKGYLLDMLDLLACLK